MKKTFALVLSLLLVLCTIPALADTVPFDSIGATIDLADGLELVEGDGINPEIAESTGAFAAILDEANQSLALFTYTEVEEITAIDLSAMSEEEIAEYAASVMDPYQVTEVAVVEVAGDLMLGISFLDDDGVEQNVLTQYGDGGFVMISFVMNDYSQITEEAAANLLEAVYSLNFGE